LTNIKKPVLREECYNCNHLFGFVLAPECRKKEYMTMNNNDRCNSYSPIVSKATFVPVKKGG